MSQLESQSKGQTLRRPFSAASNASETLLLLSYSSDPGFNAGLRAALRLSKLNNYKLQCCESLAEAKRVVADCRVDLAVIQLDDAPTGKSTLQHLRSPKPKLPAIAVVLREHSGHADLEHFDATCPIEDLSPTCISGLVLEVLHERKERMEQRHLEQTLDFALTVGALGTWELDLESGKMTLSRGATQQLGYYSGDRNLFFDDFVEFAYPADRDKLKKFFDNLIEAGQDREENFRFGRTGNIGYTLQISAQFRPSESGKPDSIFGFVKRVAQNVERPKGNYQRIGSRYRNPKYFWTASLEKAHQLFGSFKQRKDSFKPADFDQELSENKSHPVSRSPNNKTKRPTRKNSETNDPDHLLGVEVGPARSRAVKSLRRKKKRGSDKAFPFDFSSDQSSDYAEPHPQLHGFVAAVERLVQITEDGHGLSINLSVESDGVIECEQEKEFIYEIVRELLTNVVKHAQASECIIAIFRDGHEWVLQVEDDGVGLQNNLISISTPLNKIGLFRLRSQLATHGGHLDLTSTFPKGLLARARIPVTIVNSTEERA